MLTSFIADDIIIKSINICENALSDKSLNLDACHKYIIKKFNILNMKIDNNEFTASLSILTCNVPSVNNNDETKVDAIIEVGYKKRNFPGSPFISEEEKNNLP